MTAVEPQPLTSHRATSITGRVHVPGDKSISHRALIFGALAIGRTEISGVLESEDVLATGRAVAALGAGTARLSDGQWVVTGCGTGGLAAPDQALDLGNSGTGTRLLLGVIAGHDITVTLVGDESLSQRPMQRVLTPLQQMGLEILETGRTTLPLTVRGAAQPLPITYTLPVASAQVKSAILLAALMSDGITTVIEPEPTRDHTERLMQAFGANITVSQGPAGQEIQLAGPHELVGRPISVPGDPSSAAFLIAAALLVPNSDLTIENVLVNTLRTGLFETLQEMGADITLLNVREDGGEPVADIRARSSKLKGVTVPAERAPSMIDEYPILAVMAAFASGTTKMLGLAELKVKESDRLSATASGLADNGVSVEVGDDCLTVRGMGTVPGGGTVTTHLDHRLAMAFLVMGLASDNPVTVDDATMIATSFPDFQDLMAEIGAKLSSRTEAQP
ncbi:MAG: 3-phosphoshikimate 1-carboxyvinyltransferase [Alphaproteobacteria bacterium]|nr:3-phosphoshikimate 1-carboxyvinyltransferase [Alphaproteobacteria bacterium]